MKTLLNPWFIVSCVFWLFTISFRKLGYPLPFVNGYLDDLLALPVIANFTLWFQRVLVIRSNYYVLSPGQVIFIIVYVSVLFELILPHFSKVYTSDFLDVLLYTLGGVLFYMVMNKPLMADLKR